MAPTSRQRVFSLSKKLCFSAMTDQLEREKATRRGNRAVITKYSKEGIIGKWRKYRRKYEGSFKHVARSS